jgi:hypothetical protein
MDAGLASWHQSRGREPAVFRKAALFIRVDLFLGETEKEPCY